MKTRFTIAGKINLFLTLLYIPASLTVSAFLLYREYQIQLEHTVNTAMAMTEQGYQFSKPISAQEFARLLKNNHFPQQIRRMSNTAFPRASGDI